MKIEVNCNDFIEVKKALSYFEVNACVQNYEFQNQTLEGKVVITGSYYLDSDNSLSYETTNNHFKKEFCHTVPFSMVIVDQNAIIDKIYLTDFNYWEVVRRGLEVKYQIVVELIDCPQDLDQDLFKDLIPPQKVVKEIIEEFEDDGFVFDDSSNNHNYDDDFDNSFYLTRTDITSEEKANSEPSTEINNERSTEISNDFTDSANDLKDSLDQDRESVVIDTVNSEEIQISNTDEDLSDNLDNSTIADETTNLEYIVNEDRLAENNQSDQESFNQFDLSEPPKKAVISDEAYFKEIEEIKKDASVRINTILESKLEIKETPTPRLLSHLKQRQTTISINYRNQDLN